MIGGSFFYPFFVHILEKNVYKHDRVLSRFCQNFQKYEKKIVKKRTKTWEKFKNLRLFWNFFISFHAYSPKWLKKTKNARKIYKNGGHYCTQFLVPIKKKFHMYIMQPHTMLQQVCFSSNQNNFSWTHWEKPIWNFSNRNIK